ncbi:MAG: TIGR04255 family protein [Bacteroidales bacterium]|nr:TIGR04255 family protein [Bacteroidales bacterium]
MKNPPVGVALAQVKLNTENFSIQKVDNVDRPIKNILPIRKEGTHVNIGLDKSSLPLGVSKISATSDVKIATYIYFSKEQKTKLEISGDTITYVSEDRYQGWDVFKGSVLEFLGILERVFGQFEIQRTSIRFINRFSFPDFDTPEDYINTFISATGESQPYPLRKYGFRLIMDIPDTDTYSVVNHNVERVVDGKFLYTFDIDVLNNQKLLFSIDSIDNNLDNLREIKNNIFFNTLTEKTLSLCN